MASVPPPPASSPATRDRLLDAAEQLFAEHGFADASLRQITALAEANVASVNYHFGAKEDLYEAVFLRRIRPMNLERTRRLDALANAAEPPELATVLDILLAPIVELATSRLPQRHPFVRLMSRNLIEPPPFMAAVVSRELGPMLQRVFPLLRRAVPHLDGPALQFRLRLLMGATNMTYAAAAFPALGREDVVHRLNPREQLDHFIVAAEAMLRAPQPGTARPAPTS